MHIHTTSPGDGSARHEAEARLCFFAEEKPKPVPPVPGFHLDREVSKGEIVRSTGSQFFQSAKELLEMKAREDGLKLDEATSEEDDPLPKSAYFQIINEDAWLVAFETHFLDAASSGITADHTRSSEVVLHLWRRLNATERSDLFLQYAEEHIPEYRERDKSLEDAIVALKSVRDDASLREAYKHAQVLLGMRHVQRGDSEGKGFGGLVEPTETQKEIAKDNLRERYVVEVGSGKAELTEAAYDDFFFTVDRSDKAKRVIRTLSSSSSDETIEEAIDALPPSSIKGALIFGILSKEMFRDLAQKYNARESEKNERRSATSEALVREKVRADPVLQDAIEEVEFASDKMWAAFGELNGWQKVLAAALGASLAYGMIKTIFAKDEAGRIEGGGFWRLLSLAGLGVGAWYVAGVDKLYKRAGLPTFSDLREKWTGKEAKTPTEEAHVRVGEYYSAFMKSMTEHMSDHLEDDTRIHELAASAVIGEMPLSMLVGAFQPEGGGKSGVIRFNAETERFVRDRLSDGTPRGERFAEIVLRQLSGPKIGETRQGSRKWGTPLAHAFFLYGLHKCDKWNTYHDVIDPALDRIVVREGIDDPLRFVNNFDRVHDAKARQAYTDIMNAGHAAAANSDMTLADLIMSLDYGEAGGPTLPEPEFVRDAREGYKSWGPSVPSPSTGPSIPTAATGPSTPTTPTGPSTLMGPSTSPSLGPSVSPSTGPSIPTAATGPSTPTGPSTSPSTGPSTPPMGPSTSPVSGPSTPSGPSPSPALGPSTPTTSTGPSASPASGPSAPSGRRWFDFWTPLRDVIPFWGGATASPSTGHSTPSGPSPSPSSGPSTPSAPTGPSVSPSTGPSI